MPGRSSFNGRHQRGRREAYANRMAALAPSANRARFRSCVERSVKIRVARKRERIEKLSELIDRDEITRRINELRFGSIIRCGMETSRAGGRFGVIRSERRDTHGRQFAAPANIDKHGGVVVAVRQGLGY